MVRHDGEGRAATASERLKHMNELYESKRFAHFPLEIDVTKSPTILTRRNIFRGCRAGSCCNGNAVVNP